MKRITQLFSPFLLAAFLLILPQGCKTPDEVSPDGDDDDVDFTVHEEDSDYTWNTADEVLITLNGTSATITGSGATASGGKVTITKPGSYRVKGTLSDGQIVVNSSGSELVRIILHGANITSSNSAPIYIKDAGKAIIVLETGSSNSLTDGTSYTYDVVADEEPNSTIFSKSDLTLTGEGSLAVTGKFADAIVSKDGLIIKSGTYTINAADDGIRGKDYLIIHGGTFNITSKADALKSSNEDYDELGYVTINDGTFAISAGDDAIHAETNLIINNGNITISKSYEGLEGKNITINNGTIRVTSSDDGVNISDGSGEQMGGPMGGGGSSASSNILTINGGYLYVNAAGDGLDANGSIVMNGGTVLVSGPTANNNGALDYDGSFQMNGGYLVATGSSGMAQAPGTSSKQNSVMVSFSSSQAANTIVNIQSSAGNNLLTFEPAKQYQTLVFSSPELVTGSTFQLNGGGTAVGTKVDGLYNATSYTASKQYSNFTISSVVSKVTAR